jgi:nucleoside-diphosphate-sugar epimerase
MEKPAAAGNRYITAGNHYWIREIAGMLSSEFGPMGYRVPTARAPYWLMWLVARFDKTIRMALQYIGHEEHVSHEKISRDLGWQPRPVIESVIDTGYSLIEHGVVARTPAYKPRATRPSGASARSAAAA